MHSGAQHPTGRLVMFDIHTEDKIPKVERPRGWPVPLETPSMTLPLRVTYFELAKSIQATVYINWHYFDLLRLEGDEQLHLQKSTEFRRR